MWFSAPLQAVSFTRQVAPVLAMHCNSCHGGSGGLGTRTWQELMQGGNLGPVVTAGSAERSLLIHFLEGRRGEAHRMPLGGRVLLPDTIGVIRRWIDEGAQNDEDRTGRQTLTFRRIILRHVTIPRGNALRVFYRVPAACYLMLTVRQGRRVLWTDIASVKAPAEPGDAGAPGELLWRDIRAASGWPRALTLELRLQYANEPLPNVEFYARPAR